VRGLAVAAQFGLWPTPESRRDGRKRFAAAVLIGGLLAGSGNLAAAHPSRSLARAADALTYRVRSEPALEPPIVAISGKVPDPRWGDIFANASNSPQSGPIILDPQGRLVWFDPLRGQAAFDVRVQRYRGQSVLTFWEGQVVDNYGVGQDVILGHSYQQIATVRAGNGYSTDLHEFQITPRGTALITAYKPIRGDLRSVHGPRHGTLLDCVIQEVDIATGRVLWEWRASRHVPVGDSYATLERHLPYDYFHINSVQQLPHRKLLVSARNTSAVYELDERTGRIVWTLGGKHSSFSVEPDAGFARQHDAEMQRDGTLTLFDDGRPRYETASRALRIRLDPRTRRATLVRAYTSRPPLRANTQGSMQVLPDGNVFVCWGAKPYFTEFNRSGRQVFSAHYRAPLQSYRGFRFSWWGQPSTPPSIAVDSNGARATVYASWNGATDVAAWRVLAGPSAASLTALGTFRKTGFETAMQVSATEPYLVAQALDSAGRVLGTSSAASS
jgi:hypothetical protein